MRGWGGKQTVYTYPAKKALALVTAKVHSLTRRGRHRTLSALLHWLNPVLQGWCTYFRHGVGSRTFGYLDHYAWWRVVTWLRKRHHSLNWGTFRRRHLPNSEIRHGDVTMFRPNKWLLSATATGAPASRHPGWARYGLAEGRMR